MQLIFIFLTLKIISLFNHCSLFYDSLKEIRYFHIAAVLRLLALIGYFLWWSAINWFIRLRSLSSFFLNSLANCLKSILTLLLLCIRSYSQLLVLFLLLFFFLVDSLFKKSLFKIGFCLFSYLLSLFISLFLYLFKFLFCYSSNSSHFIFHYKPSLFLLFLASFLWDANSVHH